MLFATVSTQILARTTDLINSGTRMSVRLYVMAIFPIGMCYSMSLILSNLVYLYLSMGYIQLLKVSLRFLRKTSRLLLLSLVDGSRCDSACLLEHGNTKSRAFDPSFPYSMCNRDGRCHIFTWRTPIRTGWVLDTSCCRGI